MSICPEDLSYTKSHEWLRQETEQLYTIGISDHAQSMLGELVFVELPELGREVSAGEEVAVVESVKTAADVYAPLSGKIVAINDELESAPDQVNRDPYGIGWLYQIKISDPSELDELLDADAYQSSIEEE